jgi:hypothetical protein
MTWRLAYGVGQFEAGIPENPGQDVAQPSRWRRLSGPHDQPHDRGAGPVVADPHPRYPERHQHQQHRLGEPEAVLEGVVAESAAGKAMREIRADHEQVAAGRDQHGP